MELTSPYKHIKKYICRWNMSHWKLSGNCQEDCYTIKTVGKSICNCVGRKRGDQVGTCAPGEGTQKKGDILYGWASILGSKQIKPQTQQPSPGLLHGEDKPSDCGGKTTRDKEEGLEKLRFHSWGSPHTLASHVARWREQLSGPL